MSNQSSTFKNFYSLENPIPEEKRLSDSGDLAEISSWANSIPP